MTAALKAAIEVRAGVIPGQAILEHTRRWEYLSGEYEQDRNTPQDQPTIFSQRLKQAHDYAMALSNPQYLNWVRVEWMWL